MGADSFVRETCRSSLMTTYLNRWWYLLRVIDITQNRSTSWVKIVRKQFVAIGEGTYKRQEKNVLESKHAKKNKTKVSVLEAIKDNFVLYV